MTDTFARATATRAHTRSTEANLIANQALELAQHLRCRIDQTRQPMFIGRCSLCGDPCKPRARYCHSHDWAA